MRFLLLVFMVGVYYIFSLPVFGADRKTNKHSVLWLSVGGKEHFSLAFGGRGTHWGFEVGAINDGQYSSREVLDYPVPHNDYTLLGKYKIGGTYGIDVLYYPLNWSSMSIGVSVGVYFYEEAEIARSNVTGWLYRQTSEGNIEPAWGINLDWFPFKGVLLGLTFHSIRGLAVRLGSGY